jgi:putative membrane protein
LSISGSDHLKEEQDPLAKTTKYYNLIRRFSFPSLKKVLMETLLTATLGCGCAFCVSALSIREFAYGCLVGILVFAIPSVLVETTLWRLTLRNDPLFHLRRCLALSFTTNLVWIAFLLVGMIASRTGGDFAHKLFLLGMVCAYSLRSFVVFSLSSSKLVAKFAVTLSQPLACLVVAVPILGLPATKAVVLLLVAAVVSPGLLYPLLSIIEGRGKESIGVSVIELFRAFLNVFLDMRNEPLESHLEKLGVSENIDVTILAFKNRRLRKTKAIIVVSNFHPGPFLNVGSSVLPTLIQERMEAETGGVVMVPHGVSGHERNVVSQAENEKIIRYLGSLLMGGRRASTATRMVRSSTDGASATCQVFGEFGLVTLTTSPKDMEDIPMEVSSRLNELKAGAQGLALIDSHNCIDELKPMTRQDAQNLIASGEKAMKEASYMKQRPFKVGASKLKLTEFTLDQGIGPCGVSVVLTEVDGSKSAYITVDGNNMKAGLREEILRISKRMGIEEAEVMTTDTHMVSARVSTKLGYHPVGEAIDKSMFLLRIESAIKRAIEDLEDSEAEWRSGEISVKTLGRRTFVTLSMLIKDLSRFVAYWSIAIVVIPILFGIILLG